MGSEAGPTKVLPGSVGRNGGPWTSFECFESIDACSLHVRAKYRRKIEPQICSQIFGSSALPHADSPGGAPCPDFPFAGRLGKYRISPDDTSPADGKRFDVIPENDCASAQPHIVLKDHLDGACRGKCRVWSRSAHGNVVEYATPVSDFGPSNYYGPVRPVVNPKIASNRNASWYVDTDQKCELARDRIGAQSN